jgi:hypothetical protein
MTQLSETTNKPATGVTEGSAASVNAMPVEPTKTPPVATEPSPRPGQFVKTQRVFKRKPVEKDVTKQTHDEAEYILDEYSEIVTGTIVNHEQPGNPVEFWFRGNGCPDITKYEFADNAYVKMPVGVAEHLNKNCWIGKDKDSLDENGKPSIIIGRKVRRYTFYPSGYFGTIDLKPVGEPMLPLYKQ